MKEEYVKGMWDEFERWVGSLKSGAVMGLQDCNGETRSVTVEELVTGFVQSNHCEQILGELLQRCKQLYPAGQTDIIKAKWLQHANSPRP
jgi:hypothetical protein